MLQEPDFLQNFGRKVMRFIDHQGRRQIPLATPNDIMRDLNQQFTFVLAAGRKAQITSKILQKLHGRETAIEYIGVRNVFALLE